LIINGAATLEARFASRASTKGIRPMHYHQSDSNTSVLKTSQRKHFIRISSARTLLRREQRRCWSGHLKIGIVVRCGRRRLEFLIPQHGDASRVFAFFIISIGDKTAFSARRE
jgi:hypothetical protein